MARLALRTAAGKLAVFGTDRDAMESAAELVMRDHARGGAGIEPVEIAGHKAWFKRSALPARARWRWTIKHALGADLPRVRERSNLLWLVEHGFGAPAPLAAGVLARRGVPLRQFLITQDVPAAITLELFLREVHGPDRDAVLAELARETARMHAIGFVHHDLYPRNVLVLPCGRPRRIAFLDAWAGGPPPQLRPGAYDLACFLLRADRDLAHGEVQTFVSTYVAERAARGRPVDARRLLAHAKSIRLRLVERLIARPHERRGEPVPSLDL